MKTNSQQYLERKEIYEEMAKAVKNPVYRILAEKDLQNLSYTKLLEKLHVERGKLCENCDRYKSDKCDYWKKDNSTDNSSDEKGCMISEQLTFYEKSNKDTLRKILNRMIVNPPKSINLSEANPKKDKHKIIDNELIADLRNILNIKTNDDDFSKELSAYRYYNAIDKLTSGRVSKEGMTERQNLYKDILNSIKNSGEGERATEIYNSIESERQLRLYLTPECKRRIKTKECYYKECSGCKKAIVCDSEMYDELVEKEITIEKLKQLYMINEFYPHMINDFIDMFEFDDNDRDSVEKLHITINE